MLFSSHFVLFCSFLLFPFKENALQIGMAKAGITREKQLKIGAKVASTLPFKELHPWVL